MHSDNTKNDKLTFIPDDVNKTLVYFSNSSRPSDLILVSDDIGEEILSEFVSSAIATSKEKVKPGYGFIPSDIIIAGTISLPDIEIKMYIEDEYITSRVIIIDGYHKIFMDPNKDAKRVLIGLVILYMPTFEFTDSGQRIIMPIICSKEDTMVPFFPTLGYINMPAEFRKNLEGKTDEYLFENYTRILNLWYGIQVSLLHPFYKEIYSNAPIQRTIPNNKTNKKKKKRKATNIRYHYITGKKLTETLKLNSTIDRQTLIWYVCGHWRHYKTGKDVFINGYWKGPLRQTKRNLDDIRERQITPLTPEPILEK